jgi:hypothetical protein
MLRKLANLCYVYNLQKGCSIGLIPISRSVYELIRPFLRYHSLLVHGLSLHIVIVNVLVLHTRN